MKKKNQLIKVALLCMSLVAVFTMVFAANAKTKSKAGIKEWFERVSVKKCAITLSQDEFNWNGQACKPEVYLNYKGTELVKNVDFVVSYKNNKDAGTAQVVIEGKGNYKGSTTVKFQINGIDFDEQCTVIIENGVVEVYYKGALLKNKVDYSYSTMKQSFLKQSVPAGNGYLNTYDVFQYYTVAGKGKFTGMVQKTIKSQETKFEDITFTNEDIDN